MPWVEPVIDRTKADVDYAEANRNDADSLKGAMNFSDWNRVTGNIYYLADVLKSGFYITVTVTCKNSWTRADFPTQSEINKIKKDIESLLAAINMAKSVPGQPWFMYQKINIIEELLLEMKEYTERGRERFKDCGTFYAGQAEILPLGSV